MKNFNQKFSFLILLLLFFSFDKINAQSLVPWKLGVSFYCDESSTTPDGGGQILTDDNCVTPTVWDPMTCCLGNTIVLTYALHDDIDEYVHFSWTGSPTIEDDATNTHSTPFYFSKSTFAAPYPPNPITLTDYLLITFPAAGTYTLTFTEYSGIAQNDCIGVATIEITILDGNIM